MTADHSNLDRFEVEVVTGRHFGFPNASPGLLGPTSCLTQALVTARETGQFPRILTALSDLHGRWDDVRQIYRGLDNMQGAASQGEQILLGITELVRLETTDDATAAAVIRSIAQHFDQAWPVDTPAPPRLPPTEDPMFDAAMQEYPRNGSIGYWIARDAYFASRHEADPLPPPPLPDIETDESAQRAMIGETVLLFVDSSGQSGFAGKLHIELFEGGAVLYPDPLALGLTTLSRGEATGFHESVQHAWMMSGLAASHDLHGRWRIEPLTDERCLELQQFEDRSCEAAFCSALWSAAAGIPGESEEPVPELNPYAVVSARFAENVPQTPFSQQTLAPVSAQGIGPKLRALADLRQQAAINGQPESQLPDEAQQDAGASEKNQQIDSAQETPPQPDEQPPAGYALLLAEGQDIEGAGDAAELDIEIRYVARVGDAFEELLDLNRYVRSYQEHCATEWNRRFYIPDEEQEDEDGEP